MPSGSLGNIDLDEEHQAQLAAQRQAIGQQLNGPMGNAGGLGGPGVKEMANTRADERVYDDQQAQDSGVSRTTQEHGAGGVAGWFGVKEGGSQYTAQNVNDPNSGNTRAAIDARMQAIGNRAVAQSQGATAQAAASTAASASPVDQRAQNATRRRQLSLADTLTNAMNGNGPSVAQQQLKDATDRNMAQAMALQASARGGSAGLAAIHAQEARAAASQQAAGQSAQLRAQEQIQARGQLADVLNSARGQDLTASGQQQQTQLANAGFQQQTNLANASNQQQTSLANAAATQQNNQFNVTAQMTQEQQRDQAIAQLQAQGIAVDEAAIQRQISQRQFNADLLARQEAAREGISMQAGAQQTQVAGAAIGAIGTALASDERVKKNVGAGEEATDRMLKQLRPKLYSYDDDHQHFGKGRRLGVMAQDVEKGAPDMVKTDTDGVKKIDVAKALSAALAGLGSLDKRLSKMEGARGRA